MERIKEIVILNKLSHTANMMMRQLKSGEINLEEYLMKCAYWGTKTLDDIYFRSFPSKSLEVIEYEQLSYFQRQRLNQEYFADHPGVMRYYDQKEWVKTQNDTSLFRLESIKRYLPKSEVKIHIKLDERIKDFKMRMEGYDG